MFPQRREFVGESPRSTSHCVDFESKAAILETAPSAENGAASEERRVSAANERTHADFKDAFLGGSRAENIAFLPHIFCGS